MPTKEENLKPEIKSMIENVQGDLYQLESKQAKGAKLHDNVRWELEGEKCWKTSFKVLDRQNLQNQTISELYADDNKWKYCSNLKDVFESSKKKLTSINSQANNISPGRDGRTAEFYKHFSNELYAVLLDVSDSWGHFAAWVLLLGLEPYLSCMTKVTKNILQSTDPHTAILVNRLQKS